MRSPTNDSVYWQYTAAGSESQTEISISDLTKFAAGGILGLMLRTRIRHSVSAARRKRATAPQTTRQRLLEAAGQVFANKGFNAATGKEIAELAHTNTAAVNYYFGGIDELYAAVLQEARNRVVTTDEVRAAVVGKTDAKAKLEAVIGLIVPAITSPAASSWAIRILGREIVSPSPALAPLREDAMVRIGIMRGIVAELLRLPEDHATVTRGLISVMAPILLLLVYDRNMFRHMFPDFGLTPQDNAGVIRHLVQFALAGLSAVALDAKMPRPAG
jgi:AcrR family transcriptional regulator